MIHLARYAAWSALVCMSCDASSAPELGSEDAGVSGQGSLDAAVSRDASDAAPTVKTQLGEELLFEANVMLQPIDRGLDTLRFAAVVAGLRTLEILEEDAGLLRARSVAAFDPPRVETREAPLTLWALDVDCDQRTDLAFGGLGGGYVVRAQDGESFQEREPWEDCSGAVRLLLQARGTGDDSLNLRIDGAAAELVVEGKVDPAEAPPYVDEFDAVASVYALPAREGCPQRWLGVGQVQTQSLSAQVHAELTRLQLFNLSEQRYTWQDLPESQRAEAYGVVEREGDVLIGVIRALEPTGHEFVLLRQAGCADAEVLARTAIDFAWRTPPAPLLGHVSRTGELPRPGFVPRHATPMLLATKALTAARGSAALFAHYDGYDGRMVEARQLGDSWSLSFRKTQLHEDRDDLSFPFTEADVRAHFLRDAAVARAGLQ
jgi:hypothetical protein